MANTKGDNIRLGLFVLAGTVVLIVGLYMLGSKQDLFSRNITVTTTFQQVGVPPAWARHLPKSVPAEAAAQWRWYSDTAQGLPTAWFAVAGQGAQAQVAYSHQCLAPQWCMHWQPWPVPPAGQEGARP